MVVTIPDYESILYLFYEKVNRKVSNYLHFSAYSMTDTKSIVPLNASNMSNTMSISPTYYIGALIKRYEKLT